MKPLELKVYRLVHPDKCDTLYIVGGTVVYIEAALHEKRLTDAELMAEAYRQMTRAIAESGMVTDDFRIAPGDAATFGPVRRETSRLGDLHRFATLPHASETNYE